MGQVRQTPVPYVRASDVAPFIAYCRARGVPLERLQDEARLPATPLDQQDALVPLHACYRFLDAVARYMDAPDVGVDIAGQVSVFTLGSLGRTLRSTTTVFDYLVTGTRLIRSHSNSGLSLWLNLEGDVLRVNQRCVDGEGAGPDVADSYTLTLTLNTLAELIGGNWRPREVRLREGAARAYRSVDFSGSTTVYESASHSSFTVPLALLSRPVTNAARQTGDSVAGLDSAVPLPETFNASVEQLVKLQLREGEISIAAVAGSAGLSPRSFQRHLAASGTSFNVLLARCRSELAKELLQHTDTPIAAIAAELGYSDASNFSRAFCRENGFAPSAFRRVMRGIAGEECSGAGTVADLH